MLIDDFLRLARDNGTQVDDGVRLPTERTLAELSGLSRGTIREYLAAYSALGLVDKVQGSGNVLRNRPRSDGLAFELLLSAGAVSERELSDARALYEIGMIPFIVERASIDELEQLRKIAEKMIAADAEQSFEDAYEADIHFHQFLYSLIDNPIIEQAISELQVLLRMSVKNRRAIGVKAELMAEVPSGELRTDTIHLDIANALLVRDSHKAIELMREHFEQWNDVS